MSNSSDIELRMRLICLGSVRMRLGLEDVLGCWRHLSPAETLPSHRGRGDKTRGPQRNREPRALWDLQFTASAVRMCTAESVLGVRPGAAAEA